MPRVTSHGSLVTIFRATRDAAALVGAAAVIGFYAAERSFLWLAPATLAIVAVWWCVYKVHCALRGRMVKSARGTKPHESTGKGRVVAPTPSQGNLSDAVSALVNLGYPQREAARAVNAAAGAGAHSFDALYRRAQDSLAPDSRHAKQTWTLTERGVPVAVESNRHAAENWIGLGPEFDAVPN